MASKTFPLQITVTTELLSFHTILSFHTKAGFTFIKRGAFLIHVEVLALRKLAMLEHFFYFSHCLCPFKVRILKVQLKKMNQSLETTNHSTLDKDAFEYEYKNKVNREVHYEQLQEITSTFMHLNYFIYQTSCRTPTQVSTLEKVSSKFFTIQVIISSFNVLASIVSLFRMGIVLLRRCGQKYLQVEQKYVLSIPREILSSQSLFQLH